MNTDRFTIEESIRALLSATANVNLYSMGHPQVARLAESAFKGISAALSISSEITLVIIENELIINGEPPAFSLFLNRFAETLTSCGIGHIKFIEGMSREEINKFIAGLALQENGQQNLASSEHIRLGSVNIQLKGEGNSNGEEGGISTSTRPMSFQEIPAEELARFTEVYEVLKNQQKLKVNGIVEIVYCFIESFKKEGESKLVMATMKSNDECTFTHSANVCILNLAQAMALGIEGQTLHDIGTAAMLHDIGKLFVPEEILVKRDKLTSVEFEIMKHHPSLGARHLLETPGVPHLAVIAAYEHHMKYDLSGYPKPPAGWQINFCSHITMISDFFDAMRSQRPYRKPVDLRTIVNLILEMSGKDFHPLLVRNFLNILKRMAAMR